LVVARLIDWSTIAQFRVGLSRLFCRSRPGVLVDFIRLLSWSPEAQAMLERATRQARLRGWCSSAWRRSRRGGPKAAPCGFLSAPLSTWLPEQPSVTLGS